MGPEIDEFFNPVLDPFGDPPLGAPPDAEVDAASTRAGAARAPSRPSTAIALRNLMDVISKSAQSICYAGFGKGNVNPLRKGSGEIGDMTVSALRCGECAAIRQTSLTSSETILTWTALGTVAVH